MVKKKQLKRQIKKGLKFLRKSIGDSNPALAGTLAGGGGILIAAALDPKVQESAKGLALALADFVKRTATAGESDTSYRREHEDESSAAYERH